MDYQDSLGHWVRLDRQDSLGHWGMPVLLARPDFQARWDYSGSPGFLDHLGYPAHSDCLGFLDYPDSLDHPGHSGYQEHRDSRERPVQQAEWGNSVPPGC